MYYYKIAPSRDPREAASLFANDLENWATACEQLYASQKASRFALPEQAAFWTTFFPFLEGQPEHPLYGVIAHLRQELETHFEQKSLWQKGYWAEAPVETGTYYFVEFLGNFWKLKRDDQTAVDAVLKVATYLGNWDSTVPAWWNEPMGLFVSNHLGSKRVSKTAKPLANSPKHLCCLRLALLAYEMSGEQRYLQLAKRYGQRWVKAILETDGLPYALGPQGGIFAEYDEESQAYPAVFAFRQVTPEQLSITLAGRFLAYDAIRSFLTLWQLEKEASYLQAAEKILDLAIGNIASPDSAVIAASIRHYRNYTGSQRYDEKILDFIEYAFPFGVSTLAMLPDLDANPDFWVPGEVKGLPVWLENNYPRQHNPVTLGLAAEISGNERLAARSLDLGRGYLALARMAFSDCVKDAHSALSVSAIARGHRGENNAGIVTELYAPLSSIYS